MKVECDKNILLDKYKEEVKRIVSIQKELWYLQASEGLPPIHLERINSFMDYLECFKIDLFEMIADIEEPEKNHYFTTPVVKWSTKTIWRDFFK